ncbi:MAG: purine-cytosine permease family protein [Actinomycetales bacterium]
MAGTEVVPQVTAEVREGHYGTKVGAIEPGGAGFIPLNERHGRPMGLFATWMSPNLEFATVFLGVIAVAFLGLSIWQAVLAAVVGNGLGALALGLLSTRGPKLGTPQMIQSRIAFGYRGNILPGGLNAVVAGIGWFAVNSVSGALALSTLTGISAAITLIIVVLLQIGVAFMGHNFLQRFERLAFPFLLVAFVLAYIWVLPNADLAAAPAGAGLGEWLIVVGIFFGYAGGWAPFASDYTRYLPANVSGRATGWYAGLGVFLSCTVLAFLGMLVATLPAGENDSPTTVFTSVMPGVVAAIVLLAIVVGSVSANAINLYSGAMSLLTIGIKWEARVRRLVSVVAFGVLGTALAYYGLQDVSKFENFLLVIAYWIASWFGVFMCDWFLRRKHVVDGFQYDERHNPWAGFLAMLLGIIISVWLFSNQAAYVGPVPQAIPAFGDSTFEVGFVVSFVLYWIFFKLQKAPQDESALIPADAQ